MRMCVETWTVHRMYGGVKLTCNLVCVLYFYDVRMCGDFDFSFDVCMVV